MSPSGPLAGKRIVITRAPGQAEDLRAHLGAMSAEVIELPCVEFGEPENAGPLDAAIRSLGGFAWILFTSQNAARFFARRCRALGVDPAHLAAPRPRVAAIGPATAGAAAAEGFPADFVPAAGSGKTFANMLKDHVRSVAGLEIKNPTAQFVRGLAGQRMLVPRSDRAERAADDWLEILRDAGAEIAAVVAYRTLAPESLEGPALEQIRREGADCFVFASPSAFGNFSSAVGLSGLREFGAHSVFAASGPTTAAAIRAAGVRCEIQSPEPSATAVAHAIAGYFHGLPAGGKHS